MQVYRVSSYSDKVSDETIEYERETEHFFINKNGRKGKDKKVTEYECLSTDKKVCEEWLISSLLNEIEHLKGQIAYSEESIIKLIKRIEGVS